MAVLNPIYGFIVPFLFVVTVPLAIFAGITTTLAFTVLIFRVVIVYLDLAWQLVPEYLFGRHYRPRNYTSKSPSESASGRGSPSPTTSPTMRRRRRPSSASLASVGAVTPLSENGGLGLIPSVGIERDFEGVGGWRLGDDDAWATINSRLKLPDRQHSRNHHRSPSGGMTTPGADGGLMMRSRNRSPEAKIQPISPNTSRARMGPSAAVSFTPLMGDGSYFPAIPAPTNNRKAASSTG